MSRRDSYKAGDISKEEFEALVVEEEMKDFSAEWSLNASLLEEAEVYREIADFIGHVEGDAAVELGCGSGELMRAIRPWNPGMALIGADMNPHLLDVAEARSGEGASKHSSYSFSYRPGIGIVMQPGPLYPASAIKGGTTALFLDDIRGMMPTTGAIMDSGAVPVLFTLVFPGGGTHMELEHEWHDPRDRISVRHAIDTMYVSAMRKASNMMPSGGQLVLGEAFEKGSEHIAEVFERINRSYCDSRYRVKAMGELSKDRMDAYMGAYAREAGRFKRVMPSFGKGEYFVLVKLERK